ncbi:MAG: four helix bundle protein [Bacteroidota bacterium]
MLDYEKLVVYQKSLILNEQLWNQIISLKDLDKNLKDQLIRASGSITLNIAEGCSRITKPSKRNFYVIARGSALECCAILDLLKNTRLISRETFEAFRSLIEEISKMLFALIRNQG